MQKVVAEWYWVVAGATLPGSFAAIIQYILTGGVSGWIPLVATLLGGIVAAVVLLFTAKRRPLDLTKSYEPLEPLIEGRAIPPRIPAELVAEIKGLEPLAEGRAISPRTPAELVAEIKGLTEIVATDVSRRHIGQWLRVQGQVQDVSQRFIPKGKIIVSITDAETALNLYFDAKIWGSQVSLFNVEDRISAIGKIDRIGRIGWINLEECELV